MKRIALVFALVPLLGLLTMCGGGSEDPTGSTTSTDTTSGTDTTSSNSGETSADTSLLRVYLTDKPAGEYQAVYVTIARILVHQSSEATTGTSGWLELPVTATMPVDLLQLRDGVLLALCQTQLPVGTYQQLRMELTPNSGTAPPYNQSVVTADGTTFPVDVPSDTLKINHSLSITATQTTDLTLDFDAARSINELGNGSYSMKPVVTASNSTGS